MDGRLPLPTLLSSALVAFTIEFDNESEHRMPHSTTRHGVTAGAMYRPFLASLVMWSNCMQYVGESGVTAGELERLARTPTNLHGMQRWGYIVVAPGAADGQGKRSGAIIRATPAGRMAQEIWRPLFGAIEERWRVRFGQDEIGRLRESLATIISGLGLALPDCLPILGYGLASNRISRQDRSAEDANASDEAASLPLPALLSKVLLAFALEYERESPVSLAIGANVLRVTGDDGVRVRHLPRLTGVSKEALAMALGFLEKRACAVVKPESSGSRLKVFTLTTKGRQVREVYRELVWTVEERWRAHLGADAIRMVRASLEPLVGDATAQQSLLFRGLEPYPDGWRAAVPKPAVLPHYPMVLHRGGFPDGS